MLDQKKLADLAHITASRKQVSVLISNHDTDVTRRLYQGSKITKLMVSRSISQKGDGRIKVGELLALYEAEHHQM